MITVELEHFSLDKICDSGQCFRMKKLGDGHFSMVAGDQYLEMYQKDGVVDFCCSQEEFICYWVLYFDLDTDYEAYMNAANPRDKYLGAAIKAGDGIRILRQDLWEMIVTFLISQQNNIKRIRKCIETICRKYGERKISSAGVEYYAFPTVEALSQATEEELRECGLGYRAKYIHLLCQDALEGSLNLDLLSSQNYKEAIDYLTSFYGIGKKVANCVCLFGLHHIDAFPVDTWIQKILMEHYFDEKKYRRIPKSQLFDRIIEDSFGCYPGYAGVMQQYIFNYERNVIGKNQT